MGRYDRGGGHISQFGHLALGKGIPRPFLMDFGGGLLDYGIVVRFLEKPDLEISRFVVDLIVGSLRATNRTTFFKIEKFEKFFFKKISIFKNLKFFLKKLFKLFDFEKSRPICGP